MKQYVKLVTGELDNIDIEIETDISEPSKFLKRFSRVLTNYIIFTAKRNPNLDVEKLSYQIIEIVKRGFEIMKNLTHESPKDVIPNATT